MSTLVTPTQLLALTDRIGLIYNRMVAGIDNGNQEAQSLLTDLAAQFTSDSNQENEWYPYVTAVYTPASGLNASGQSVGFGGLTVAPGSFGRGFGLLNRQSEFQTIFSSLLDNCIRPEIAKYGAAVNTAIVDLSSHAAYENGQTPFSELYSPDFASAYWYGYRMAKQLDAVSIPGGSGTIAYPPVFAPQGMQLATGTITAADTITLSNNSATNWPAANGYGAPSPANAGPGYDRGAWSSATAYNAGDAVSYNGGYYIAIQSGTNQNPATATAYWKQNTFGNNLYLGNVPMAQWFAPMKSAQAHVTTNINGTCALTVTAPAYDSSGLYHASRTFTATLDNDTAGTVAQLTPTVSGDRMAGVPTALAVAGTATAGVLNIETGTPERTIL